MVCVCIPHRPFLRCSFTASGRHLRASRFTTSRETFGALCPSGIKYSFRWLHISRAGRNISLSAFFSYPRPRDTAQRSVSSRRFLQDVAFVREKASLSNSLFLSLRVLLSSSFLTVTITLPIYLL